MKLDNHSKMFLLSILVVIFAFLIGCNNSNNPDLSNIPSVEQFQKEYEQEQKEGPPEPEIGMTTGEVLMSSWGSPEHTNRTKTANGVHEQWVYYGNRYIYLDNGVVTAIQD